MSIPTIDVLLMLEDININSKNKKLVRISSELIQTLISDEKFKSVKNLEEFFELITVTKHTMFKLYPKEMSYLKNFLQT